MATFKGDGSDNTINGTLLDDDIRGKGGNDMLYGLDGNDIINGGVGDDFLFGGVGDDVLIGGKGNDTMQGDAGADIFRGGKGIDTADYSTSTSAVTAHLVSGTVAGDAMGDTYVQMENVIGSGYDDSLQAGVGGLAAGGSGADWLFGGGTLFGTEDGGRLRGDAGYDSLSMYFGATEAWLQNGQGYDTLYGFDEGTDSFFVKLSDFGLGNSLDASEVTNSNTATAVGTNAQFIYEDDAGKLWFDSNGTETGGKVLVASFEASTIDYGTLDTGDFNWVA